MLLIRNNLREVTEQLPAAVKLVAVSKFQPLESLQQAYAAGQRRFGESRADELAAKAAAMPDDVEWHFIGHLQTNKVRRVVAHASVIESVDSLRLLQAISNEAEKSGKVMRVLLQVHVAAEETKTGFLPEELSDAARVACSLPGVEVIGIMGMATNTDSEERVSEDFRTIAELGKTLRSITPDAAEISMGMTGDWSLAVEAGATIVRIGSGIFGSRPPKSV